jgi:hypothetical protein
MEHYLFFSRVKMEPLELSNRFTGLIGNVFLAIKKYKFRQSEIQL